MSDNRRVDFAELRARADFRTVLAHYGIAIKGAGDQVKALCPLHDDERPSLSINLDKRRSSTARRRAAPGTTAATSSASCTSWRRTGAHDLAPASRDQAGRHLRSGHGGNTPPRRQEGHRSARRRRRGPGTPARAPDAAPGPPQAPETATPEGNRPFNRTLTLDPAHPYLSERGLSPALVATFGLGFYAGEKGIMLGRVCIPIHNAEGELVAYAGRWVGPDDTLPRERKSTSSPRGFRRTSSSSTCTGSSTAATWSWSRATSARSACTASGCPRSP